MAFPFLPVLAAAGSVIAVRLAMSAPSPTGAVPRTLKPFRWYRVRYQTDQFTPPNSRDLVTAWVKSQAHLQGLGFDPPLYVVRDSQNGVLWDAFARFRGGGPPDMAKANVLRADEVLDTSPFAPSPSLLPWLGPYPYDPLDRPMASVNKPMPIALHDAVAYAVTHDTDEDRLEEFSVSMLPDYTYASKLLQAKRNAVRAARKERYSLLPVLALHPQENAQTLVGISTGRFFLALATGGASEVIIAVAPLVESIVDTIVDVGRKVLEIIKTAAPFIQLGLSFIPGIGTVASAALGAGIALASGRPITDALIEAARGAFPGGPIVAKAVEAGIRTLANLAQGQSLDEAALNGIRGSLSQAEKMAFDTTIALAQGKKIQDAAIAGVRSISPEATTVLQAISDGKPIDGALLAQAAAARAGLSPQAQAALSAVTGLVQGGRIEDAAVNAARSKLSPDARASFDAALAIAQKRDPQASAIAAAQSQAPNTPEARVAGNMTRQALQGVPTPATLGGEAARFIPNAPPALRGAAGPLTAAEAERISSQGPKAFTRPELYLPNTERRALDRQAAEAALRSDAAAEEERQERDRVRVLLSTSQAQRAVEGLREILRLAEVKQRATAEMVAASKAAYEKAAILHAKIQNSWVFVYEDLKRTSLRGGVPDFSYAKGT